MDEDLPYYWKMKNCVPLGYNGNIVNKRVVYGFLFFERKRTLLIDKDFNLLGTMETRYARKLVEEAKERGWTSQIPLYSGGPRPEGYPKTCDGSVWTKITSI